MAGVYTCKLREISNLQVSYVTTALSVSVINVTRFASVALGLLATNMLVKSDVCWVLMSTFVLFFLCKYMFCLCTFVLSFSLGVFLTYIFL